MKFFPVMKNVLLAPVAIVGTVWSGLAITARTVALLLFLSASSVLPALAQSQTVVIDCLPPWEANGRFLDTTLVKHPSLSLNGFDCGSNCNIGYGLKQVLEKTYGANKDDKVKAVFKNMADMAAEPLGAVVSSNDISKNTQRLQARGFVALAAYVLDNNDYDPTTLNPALPSAAQAVSNFISSLQDSLKWKMRKSKENDGVKWASPVANVARAIDFYLTLENAYKHYDYAEYIDANAANIPLSAANLLSMGPKTKLVREYTDLIEDLEDRAKYPTLLGNNVLRYNFEPGNAPLKMQVAIGYALLTLHPHTFSTSTTLTKRRGFIQRAFEAAGKYTIADRHKYWSYQSDVARYFWAEGPYYFHITLSTIIPFWHTVRINDMLQDTDVHPYMFADPFTQPWFLNPLHWLADISTPDGKTPPLDDGNKTTMYTADILRWTSDYGNDAIGEKFARVVGSIEAVKGLSLWAPLYPVAIAIPRRSVSASTLPDGIIGKQFQNRTDGENGRQEVVLRRTINGRQHYILLNGESGDAIERGEGHEQGDQMQLLYYADTLSYLVDSGYDRPRAPSFDVSVEPLFFDWDRWLYSTWNTYTEHNVMTMKPDRSGWHNVNGGIQAPSLNKFKRHVERGHQSVNEIYHRTHGNIDLISANIGLNAAMTNNQDARTRRFADYYRNVLFIRDPQNPYLIDINAISGDAYDRQNWYRMNYHVNSNRTYRINRSYQGDPNIFVALRWDNIYKSQDDNISPMDFGFDTRLIIQPFTIERRLYFSQDADKIRESRLSGKARGVGINIKKLTLYGSINNSIGAPATSKENFTTVAFIRSLSDLQGINYAKENRPLPGPGQGDRQWQYLTWSHDSSTVDVVASRSAKYYVNTSSTSSSRGPLHFPIAEADSFYVELPYNLNYGFVRLTKQNEIWNVDPSFQLNLKKSVPIVTLYGPSCIREGATGHYTSSRVTGGKPPYSYAWQFYRICPRAPECNAWNGIGTTGTVDFSGYNGEDFKIRLRVTDSSSPARSSFSSELDVQILSSTEGACPLGPDGKKSPDAEETLVSDTDLLEADEEIPEAYALRQNFPNPFNPSTEIQFDLSEDAMVSLIVYDVLGREVARLVHEELRAGTHRARFDAGNLPSGVYFYRIQAGDFHSTHRMTLLK